MLIRAPAGFGKTTLMAQCRARFEMNCIDTAWLTLDNGDNDASRFVANLAAAAAQITTAHLPYPQEIDPAHRSFSGELVLDIMASLGAHTPPFALFLDEFENLHAPPILALVREIINHLPRQGQLIVGTRGRPNLGLGRLRARRQLVELDESHLRFSIEETVEFFTQCRRVGLSEGDMTQLHLKSDGWIAALWLASLVLERLDGRGRSEFIARFSGSHEAVSEYLVDDVLAKQSDHIRNFLLHTSILRELNAPLCDALLARTDSAQTLIQLKDSDLFLLPLQGDEEVFRYHPMFAQFLRAYLMREKPDELERLHHSASQWYEAQGRLVPAIDHALDGHHFERASNLLSCHAESFLEQDRMLLLTKWLTAMPESFVHKSPLLQVVRAWALCFSRGPWDAMQFVESSGCLSSKDPNARTHILALHPTLLAMMDRTDEAYKVGTESLTHLPIANPFAQGALANTMAYMMFFHGRHVESHKLLDTARHCPGEIAKPFHRMYAETILGIMDLEEGRLRQATSRFRMAINSTDLESQMFAHGNAFAGIMCADALYETNDLVQAAHLLHVYVPLTKNIGLADHVIIGCLRLARIAGCHGDIDLAFRSLTDLEYLGYERRLSRLVLSAQLERARMLLLQGNQQGAKDELHRAQDPMAWEHIQTLHMPANDLDYFKLGALRWEVHFCCTATTLRRLECEIAAALESRRYRRALKLRVLQCLAYENSGDQSVALATMDDVLKIACKEGFQRLVIDEGDGVGRLVRRLVESMRQEGTDRRDIIYSEYLQRLLKGFGPIAASDDDKRVADQHGRLVGPLTSKEQRILLLLADGYSNIAIADKLFVTESTVRTHLRNIYTKLNAQSRTKAIAIAHRLGLIPR